MPGPAVLQLPLPDGASTEATLVAILEQIALPSGGAVAGTAIAAYNEVTGVAMGSGANVLVYTVPGGKTLYLTRIEFSGDALAEVTYSVGATTEGKKRLTWQHFNDEFNLTNSQNGLPVSAGTTVTVHATNKSPLSVGSYNATLYGVLTP